MSYKPRVGIWNWLDDDSEDEMKTNGEREMEEQQELERLFGGPAGFEFTWYVMYGRTTVDLYDDSRNS